MTFLSPWFLLLLVPVAALAVAMWWSRRRREAYALRFAALPMLERLIPRRPGWRRHVTAGLALTVLALLAVAAARPDLSRDICVSDLRGRLFDVSTAGTARLVFT